jgi:hypothetical protein
MLTKLPIGRYIYSSAQWFNYLEQLENGFLEIPSPAHCFLHMVCNIGLSKQMKPFANVDKGTFWLVQGTSLIPSFAVGTMYSSTGDTLQGITTAEYNATVGKFPCSRDLSTIQ